MGPGLRRDPPMLRRQISAAPASGAARGDGSHLVPLAVEQVLGGDRLGQFGELRQSLRELERRVEIHDDKDLAVDQVDGLFTLSQTSTISLGEGQAAEDVD